MEKINSYDIFIRKIKKQLQQRELVVWGNPKDFEKYLAENEKIVIKKHFFWTESKVDKTNSFHMDDLKDSADKYLLINLDIIPNEKNTKDLLNYGFVINQDLLFFLHPAQIFSSNKESGQNMVDEYDNKVSFCPSGCTILFNSYNCSCSFAEGVTIKNKLNIEFKGDNSSIIIGSNTSLGGAFLLNGSDCNISIEGNCNLPNLEAFLYDNSVMNIKERTTVVQSGLTCIIHPYGELFIGKDTMFSNLVKIWVGDGHTIFDVNSKKPINIERSRITIHNHVWVGTQCILLAGAEIGSGSIVGARSLVNKAFPNNIILAGTPAKILRKDVAWTRKMVSENIHDCGIENINFTDQ